MYVLPKDTEITDKVIKEALECKLKENQRLDLLRNYYLGEHAILSRNKPDILANNQVMVNHAKFITDINVGYLLGNPVEWVSEQDIETVKEAFREQTINDLDHEIAKDVSIYGEGYEYIYSNEDSEPRSAKIDPRHCVVVYDDTVQHNKMFAIVFRACEPYSVGGVETMKYKDLSVLTDTEIREYNEDLSSFESYDHYFGQVPVIDYRNNPEKSGDFETVSSLIDAYNTVMSDRVNDKQQLVEAFMLLTGMTLEDDQMTALKVNRVMTADIDADAKYVTKDTSEQDIDVLRQVLESDIHKISMTPNLTDENFIGNSSGVAIRYKLIAFEQSIKNKERYFEKGLKDRFAAYNSFYNKASNMPLVPTYDIQIVFRRNLPQNDVETAQMIMNLSDFVDTETLLGQLSFIDDAEKVIEKKDEEREKMAKLYLPQFGTGEENQGDEDSNDGQAIEA